MIDWHRLFGLALMDFFTGSPFVVELEKDLSLKKQLLDVVVLRRLPGEFSGTLPDGFESLCEHNLLSYKSLWEPLDDWAVDELLGHYVNYRKQAGSEGSGLLPHERFGLYAVSTRFPQKLSEQVVLDGQQPGVYSVRWGTHRVAVLVLSEMPPEERNAVWLMFSAVRDKVVAGAAWYCSRTGDMSTLMNGLFERYQLEGVMPYTWEDFRRDYAREHLDRLTPEERLRGLPPEERLRGLPPEERLRGLSTEERLQGLSQDEIEIYLAKLKGQRRQRKR
ncbi:MAG: hypothetical protein HY321_20850 [Armatimonadetes bacterium]|nr:hypothetical protein [Armatimonadota bacterium]